MLGEANFIIAVCSIFIATLTAAFVGYQAIVSRNHNKLSVRPHLSMDWRVEYQSDKKILVELNVINKGLGPAVISEQKVIFDDNLLGNGDNIYNLANKIMKEKNNFDKKIGDIILDVPT